MLHLVGLFTDLIISCLYIGYLPGRQFLPVQMTKRYLLYCWKDSVFKEKMITHPW